MSVHLHEIQYDDLKREFQELESMGEPIAFFIGDMAPSFLLKPIADLARLPYPLCWFEGFLELNDPNPHRYGVLAFNAPEHLVFLHFSKLYKGWDYLGYSLWVGAALHNVVPSKSAPAVLAGGDAALSSIAAVLPCEGRSVCLFLSALNCNNVKRVENRPTDKLQKARIKRGKAPLFSYWTLELDLGGASEKAPHRGGTHASPRVHLRRGHPRQYAPGLWTWVQPHAVGNKALGMVHKDYAVKPAEKWGEK